MFDMDRKGFDNMKIAQRLHYRNWREDRQFEETISFLQKYKDTVDEITLFSSNTTNGSADDAGTLDRFREDLPVMQKRIQAFKEAGFKSVGINLLITIGHIDESKEPDRPLPFPKIVGYQGDMSNSCHCPVDEDFLLFTEEKYRLCASAGPDFIWVDDDIKLFWNGVKFGCFCPECLRRFNEANDFSYTRESLVADMEVPENQTLRSLWVTDVSNRITQLLCRIGAAVRSVDPSIRLGFMTQRQSWSTYNGMDFPEWFTSLGAVMGRPGEGCYFDALPEQLLVKTFSTAQQAYEYPETVTDIQYELENFPIHSWQKSAKVAATELALAAAAGMNGVLLNNSNEFIGLRGQERLYDSIAHKRDTWKLWLETGSDWKCGGFYPAFSRQYDQRRTMEPGESFFTTFEQQEKHDVTRCYALSHMGIPITMQRSGAWGTILTGSLSQGYTDEELKDIFRGPVIVSGDAVRELARRGFEQHLGVRYLGSGSLGLHEEINIADAINSALLDIPVRDVHPCFWPAGGDWFEAIADNVRIVSFMKTQEGELLGAATTLYENSLGGRVCVLGYAPFHMQNDLPRFLQMSGIIQWLVGKRQSVCLMTPGKTALFVREGEDGLGCAVLNLTMDDQTSTEISVIGDVNGWLCTTEGKKKLKSRKIDGRSVFDLGASEPWEVQFFVAKNNDGLNSFD